MSVQINHIPQLQLMSGDIKNDCIKDLALMLEDLYNTGEQGETPNKMNWSGFEKKNKHPDG